MISKERTIEKISSGIFSVGDIFTEMLCYYEIIADIKDEKLLVFNNRGRIDTYTIDEFKNHCRYSNIEGYWIDFFKNDSSYIDGFIENFIEKSKEKYKKEEEIREFKIDFIMTLSDFNINIDGI